jgi:hypothetical protein
MEDFVGKSFHLGLFRPLESVAHPDAAEIQALLLGLGLVLDGHSR